MHLLEELSLQKPITGVQYVPQAQANQTGALQAPDPPRAPLPDERAPRTFIGNLAKLELLINIKEALLHRVDEQQRKQFKEEIVLIKKQIEKIKITPKKSGEI